MVPQSILSKEIVFAICREYKITSADIFCKCDATIDQLIDVIEGNRRYIPVCIIFSYFLQFTSTWGSIFVTFILRLIPVKIIMSQDTIQIMHYFR
jgi:ribosome-interacting GTPase 1